jgi:hypothetical protein
MGLAGGKEGAWQAEIGRYNGGEAKIWRVAG